MKSDTPLDHAVFQLSPKRSRCELFVSSNGNTEKLASGLIKPFVTHLKVAEEQVAQAVQSIKLEIERDKNAETWFTRGTLQRFVRFVSTPEVLEMVNTFDAEMSQLEAAQTIYSQGAGDKRTDAQGGDGTGSTTAADATKKELLRAIDVRLTAVRQDLTAACARASAAGFNPDTVSELQHFANRFGAHHLNEACTKFISVYHRRSDLISPWNPGGDERVFRSSVGSDMSIDDPAEDQYGPRTRADQAHPFDKPIPSTWQQNKSFVTFASRRSNVNEKDEDAKEEIRDNVSEEKNKEEAATESLSIAATQPSRRLSVQDRISLFENKQKESSGGKPIVVKSVELRRLSSDVSSGPTAAEKSVLRRWSGASDMSIDVSGEKKDTESPLFTPSSVSSVPHIEPNAASVVSEDKGHRVLNNSENASNAEPQSGAPKFGDGALKDQANTQTYSGLSAAKEKEPSFNVPTNWKDQAASRTKFGSFTGRAEQAVKNDLWSSQETSKVSALDEARSGGYKGHVGSESQLRGFSDRSEITFAGPKTQVAPQVPVGVVTPTVGDVTSDIKFSSRREDSGTRNRLVAQSHNRGSHNHSRSFSGQFDGGAGLKFKDASSVLVESDQSTHQPQGRTFTGEYESVKKESSFPVKQQIKVEDSEIPKMKYQKPHLGSFEQISKSNGKRDESRIAYENSKSNLPVKEVLESQDSIHVACIAPVEQVQRVRQSKGNQVLNDELKMKANELEKLFAEHKLRVPGDQSGSARRIESANTHVEQAANSQYKKPEAVESTPQMPARNKVLEPAGSSINVVDFDVKSLMKMVENHNYGDSLRQSFSNLSFSGDSRGKFYEKYMQKRDAKLREEWSSKRVEKEARMKAMQDSLERSRAEMKAKFSGFADRQDSVSTAHRRAEKLSSFNFQLKREQHPIEALQNEEDDDLAEFSEEKIYGQGILLGESTLGDSASRQSRKNFPGRSVSSSTPRTATASMPRSSAKISSSVSGRRRGQSESPLAQSVPNFSDLRKENTRPSGVSKTTRSQVRNHTRCKSINEEIAVIKDEKSKRTQSLRKSPATSADFEDLSSLKSDGVVLVPLKFDMEQADLGTYDQSPKGLESRSFLKKGNGIGPGAGVNAVRRKASMASETQQDEEFDELEFEVEDLGDAAKEEEDEIEAVEDCTYTNNGRVRQSQESEKSGNSGSEIGYSRRSLTQVDPVSAAEMPSTMVSNFNNVGSLQDSPVESPVSLNSRMRYPFSYPHESSDIDASMDSPIGSPASWNSHSLTQNETDAARMRKKWGTSQKPFVVTNLSHNQSRKDVTKGFKRLLKFGRKNRGSETLVDWISATTSEGDDDTEDGRDLANRSSEDLRKSRMRFSQGHPSDDNFNESELFSDQVLSLQSSIPAPPAHFKLRDDHISGSSLKAPRSFFSLSSFRSKGSDTKLR
ncbi:hypothetical protein L6164_021359 [Bauhinia variegata]|uniref:Uncharacterized protein n=1 Tax=Bauhinia variegata TaxID=167791 RepID=A0ACB9MY89_BAUVA|nr:hypothetical protein L6164_021359 [Bauhinia variegata]